jgi:hypothetical protein
MNSDSPRTEREREAVELAVEWRQETKTVAREIRWHEFLRVLDLVVKDRRDEKAQTKNT